MPSVSRNLVAGLTTIAVIFALIGLVVAVYTEAFTPRTILMVETGRAGLLTDIGAAVRLHGAKIGKVTDAVNSDSGVTLKLAINPDYVEQIAPNPSVHITASTAFGGKSVDLDNPVGEPTGHIEPGTVIAGAQVTTEVNTLFENTTSLLTTVKPNELNASLSAVATALRGQGNDFGEMLGDVDAYLPRLTPELPTLHHDFDQVAAVADIYHQATPNLLHLLGNFDRTSRTVVSERGALHDLLIDLSRMSRSTKGFLNDVGPNLDDATRNIAPVLDLLADYSPEITCVVHGINRNRELVDPVAGGNQPGLELLFTLEPSADPYRYPRDLPMHTAKNGPECYDLPYLPASKMPIPIYPFADGTHTREHSSPPFRAGQLTNLIFGDDGGPLARMLYPEGGRGNGPR